MLDDSDGAWGAEYRGGRSLAIDRRRPRHAMRSAIGQRIRKRIEEAFGW